MIFEISKKDSEKILIPRYSSWNIKELELEQLIIGNNSGSELSILDENLFNEPLLFIRNQPKTKNNKRADILALDRFGSGVIIELKKDIGRLGVETQALQYLADFSKFKGNDFIKKFSNKSKNDEYLNLQIKSFLGGNAEINNLNQTSRIILIARSFDQTLFSMGEWLSEKGVSFKCIKYTPLELNFNSTIKHFIDFSVAFDRPTKSIYPVSFSSTTRDPKIFWHNIANNQQEWWSFLVENEQIPACFENSAGDKGEELLLNYINGDRIIPYATGFGALGWGEIKNRNSYRLIKKDSKEDLLDGGCLHRMDIKWMKVAKNLKNSLSAEEIREKFNIFHPLSTSVSISAEKGENLINFLNTNLDLLNDK